MTTVFSSTSKVICLVGLIAVASSGNAAEVSFRRDLAPLLQEKCVTCHGPEKQKGGYRLDSFEWLQKSGDSGYAPIVAGKPEESELFKRVTATDPDDRMPQKSDPLSAGPIQQLRDWLRAGAHFDGTNQKQSLADLAPPPAYPAPPASYPHPIPVLSLAPLGPSGRLVVGGYHEILICDATTGRLWQRVTNIPERVQSLVAFDEGHRLLYAGGNPGRSGEAGFIEIDTQGQAQSPRTLARSTDTFLAAAVSPNDQLCAVGGSDNVIHLLDLKTHRELRQLTQHADWVMGLAFSRDGKRLASASRDGTARIYDTETGDDVCTFREHDGPVFDVVFVGKGEQAVSGGRDGHVRFWTTDKGNQTKDVGGLSGELFKFAIAGDSLLCATGDGLIQEISLSRREKTQRWQSPDPGDVITAAAIDNGKAFICGLSSGKIQEWKTDTQSPVHDFVAWP